MTISTSIFDSALSTLALIKQYLGGDSHENDEPVHDPIVDIDAAWINKTKAGLAEAVRRMQLRGTVQLTAQDVTTLTTAGEWYSIAGTFGDMVTPIGFTRDGNKLTYTDPNPYTVNLALECAFTSDKVDTYIISLFVNGTQTTIGLQGASIVDVAGVFRIGMAALYDLEEGDEIEFKISANTENAVSLTMQTFSVVAQ